jgi:NAD(P)-dependent dehydrogenase (short-subunit alcohol dehydrogenase family)
MDLGLAGKGVVVTGGSRASARGGAQFAEEGAHVAICARRPGARGYGR